MMLPLRIKAKFYIEFSAHLTCDESFLLSGDSEEGALLNADGAWVQEGHLIESLVPSLLQHHVIIMLYL